MLDFITSCMKGLFSFGTDLLLNDNSSSRQVERYREQDYDYYPAQQQSYQYITHYDPDSVEVARLEVERAELENERVQLMKQAHLEVLQKQADLEQQRIEHIKQAQLDLLKFQQMTQSALEELKQKGLVQLMQCIQTFYDEVSKNVIQRHNFVEHCHTLNQEQVYQLHNRLKEKFSIPINSICKSNCLKCLNFWNITQKIQQFIKLCLNILNRIWQSNSLCVIIN